MKKNYLLLALLLLILPLKVSAFTVNDAKNSPVMQSGSWYTGVATDQKASIHQFKVTERGYCTITFNIGDYADTDKIGNGWELSLYRNDDVANYFIRNSFISGKYVTPKLSLEPGTYYAVVENRWGNENQPYKLKFDQAANNQWEQENNGNYTTATKINLNQTVYGMGLSKSDYDWYTFTVPQDGSLTLCVNRETAEMDSCWHTYLYKSPELFSDIVTLYRYGSQKTITVTQGTYYIRINSISDSYKDTYSFVTTYTPFKTSSKSPSKTAATTAKPKKASFSASAKKGKITLSIGTKASKYEIQYGRKKSMKNCKKKITASSKVTLKKLKRKKTYYVRVRLVNSSGKKGAWSSIKKVKVK